MSSHTTETPEAATVVDAPWVATSGDITASRLSPLSWAMARCVRPSRTVSEATSTGTGKPLVSSSS